MDVGRQGLARSAQLGCVMLVEFVPLVAFAGLAHVRRRGHGSLGSGQSVLMKMIGRPTSTTMTANITGMGISETTLGITVTIVPDGDSLTQTLCVWAWTRPG